MTATTVVVANFVLCSCCCIRALWERTIETAVAKKELARDATALMPLLTAAENQADLESDEDMWSDMMKGSVYSEDEGGNILQQGDLLRNTLLFALTLVINLAINGDQSEIIIL